MNENYIMLKPINDHFKNHSEEFIKEVAYRMSHLSVHAGALHELIYRRDTLNCSVLQLYEQLKDDINILDNLFNGVYERKKTNNE